MVYVNKKIFNKKDIFGREKNNQVVKSVIEW